MTAEATLLVFLAGSYVTLWVIIWMAYRRPPKGSDFNQAFPALNKVSYDHLTIPQVTQEFIKSLRNLP